MIFVDKNNNVIQRKIEETKRHRKYIGPSNENSWDFTVGLLDFDIPTNQIMYAKVLPDDFSKYLYTGAHLPVVCLNQYEEALVGDLSAMPIVPANTTASKSLRISTHPPENLQRKTFNKNLKDGDSGNPCFLFITNQPVILTVWTSMTISTDWTLNPFGTSIHTYKEDINTLMNELGGGYQLEEIDLSVFNVLPIQE